MSEEGIAISLFSGAGGLDLGVERVGYRVAAAVEPNDDAADTMEKNFPGLASPVIRGRHPRRPDSRDRPGGGSAGSRAPRPLVGGPPCTPFSKSGFWLEWKRAGLDPDASLLQAYTRVLAEARPRAFLLENVYALTYNNKASRPAFRRLLKEIDDAGYRCTLGGAQRCRLRRAAAPAPSLRGRSIASGARLPALPVPTHGRSLGTSNDRAAGQTACHRRRSARRRRVVSGARRRSSGGQWAHLLPSIPPGGNYLHYTAERGHSEAPVFEWRSRYWSFLLKLDPERAVPDHPGAPRSERRTVPLGEPAPPGRRAQAPLHLPRRLRIRRARAPPSRRSRQLSARPCSPNESCQP